MLDTMTILYVEDDPNILDQASIILSLQFKEVYTAMDGQQGLELFKSKHPDIILTDVTMPVMSGLEMAAAIKEIDEETPIILLTALDDPGMMTQAINIGIDGYLGKPIHLDAMTNLFMKIAKHIDNKRQFLREAKLLHEYKKAVDEGSLVSKTDPEGIITYVNDAFCQLSGYSREELIGSSHNIIRHPDVPKKLFKELWKTILDKQIWQGSFKNLKKDGSAYYVSAMIAPILDEHDEIVEFLALRQDITRHEESEQQLQQRVKEEVEKNLLARRAREQERLQEAKFLAIGRLAAGITHEINTPLTYIRGNLEMMREDINLLDESDFKSTMLNDTETILGGVSRIASIVESMREMASQSKEVIEPTSIFATLYTALVMAYNRSKQITRITLQGDPFELGIDKTQYDFYAMVQKQRIEQVWIIIINNALDALKTVEPYEARRLDITINESEAEVIVTFQDNGGGIDKTVLPKIFDAFESTKVEGGMGIGLNVAKKIIDDHRGNILAYNENDGAVFKVTLPKKH